MPARRFGLWAGFVGLGLLAFPCWLSGLLALPLCGAAPTSLCRPQREVGKRKRLTPPVLKWVPWLGGDCGASGIGALAHSALVTQQSFFRRRCARRRGTSSNRRQLPRSAVVLPPVALRAQSALHRMLATCRARRCAVGPLAPRPATGAPATSDTFETAAWFRRHAEAKPMAPTAPKRSRWCGDGPFRRARSARREE